MPNVGRPPVNSPYKVQRQPGTPAAGDAFEAAWDSREVAPYGFVGITAKAKVAVNAKAVQIAIYHLSDGRSTQVDVIGAPIISGNVSAKWCAKPFREGNCEEGAYHFVVSTGAFKGESARPLVIRRTVNTNRNTFTPAPAKPPVKF